MSNVAKMRPTKQPRRPHHIQQWAERKHLTQAQLVDELGADKSIVSRWYSGSSPSVEWQAKLAAFFGCEPEGLFRDPNDYWLSQFLKGRDQEEVDRIRATLETAFPARKKTA